jgi:RNA polymerase sigma-70 factor (ECF subfamily)
MALSDSELVINAQSGDTSAFEDLVYRYDKMVFRLAVKYSGDSDIAKDIYQEVFIKVYRGLKSFQFKSEFSTWLFRITSNVCISHKGREKKNIHLSIDRDEDAEQVGVIPADENSSPEKQLANKDFNKEINRALQLLSPNQKMSFLLKHYEGYKIREIAEMMDCKEGTIKKYLFEAVRKLRVQLADIY